MKENIKTHFIFAQIPPLISYLFFTMWGFASIDHGLILIGVNNVKNGLIPYKDFGWVVTPLTLYLQAFLQKLIPFFDEILISRLWKGISFSILSGLFLLFLFNLFKTLKIEKKLPLSFVYLFPVAFMFLGPIHETHVGYTTDAIFFSCLGLLFVNWPLNTYVSNWIKRIVLGSGYFLLGFSFGFKQEIGIFAIVAGLLHLSINAFVFKKFYGAKKIELFINILLLFITPILLVLLFNHINGLDNMLFSIFTLPFDSKMGGLIRTLYTFVTLGYVKTYISIIAMFSFLTALLVCYLLDNNLLKKMVKFITFGKQKLFYTTLRFLTTFSLLGFITIIAISSNYVFSWHRLYRDIDVNILAKFQPKLIWPIFDYSLVIVISIIVALFVYIIIKLLHQAEDKKLWVKYFVLPVLLLFVLFSASTLAGFNAGPRMGRNLPALLLASTLVGLIGSHSKYTIHTLRWRKINSFFVILILIFGIARCRGVFSGVTIDPFYRDYSYSDRLKCFVDKKIFNDIVKIEGYVGRSTENNLLIYQSEPMLYYFLNKRQPGYSIVYFRDFYSPSFDSLEISTIEEKNVPYVLTHKTHERVNNFMYREIDPIRDYIEEKYTIIYSGNYYFLWKRSEQL